MQTFASLVLIFGFAVVGYCFADEGGEMVEWLVDGFNYMFK